MARSSKKDPIDKFRFRVTVVSLDLSAEAAITTIAGLSSGRSDANDKLGVITRAGFSRIAPMPQATISTMTYRENLDNLRSIKVPGLATYNDVTLSRGSVVENRDLYNWFRLVNEELALLTVANEFVGDQNFTPTQSSTFRKDVIIESLDREGNPTKAWYLFNAWPNSYTPGDSLDAQAEDKLVEELTLSYEAFIELEGGADGLLEELSKGLFLLIGGAVVDDISNTISGSSPGGGSLPGGIL